MNLANRYAIFEKRYSALGSDEPTKEYLAVPVDYLSNGIFIPASHYEIDPTVLTEIDAGTPEEAIEAYRQTLEDAFM